MEIMKIIAPGILTTVQDKGRYGFEQYGIPVTGVMDWFSYQAANLLAGNREDTAVLEITASGPMIEFLQDTYIALTGADLSPKLNNTPIVMYHSVSVYKGDVLTFGSLKYGLRAYLAVAGGIDVPWVMNSRSTYLKGQMGGFMGRRLEKGDILSSGKSTFKEFKQFNPALVPQHKNHRIIRVIGGPQEEYFTENAVHKFYNTSYEVTGESDRMGYRLEGEKLAFKDSSDIVSDGIAMGAIQVPGSGLPIILMADRQTAGGYPKIASIIKADLPLVAQAKPGDTLSFQRVSVEQAHHILKEQNALLDILRNDAKPVYSPGTSLITVKINGKTYQLEIKKIL